VEEISMKDSVLRPLFVVAAPLGLLTLSACNSVGVAQDPVTPQRPLISRDTHTTGFGTFEVEAGGELDPTDRWSAETRLSVGLSENSELFVDWTAYEEIESRGTESDLDGSGDVFIGWKQRLLDATDTLPSTAIQLSASLPTADEEGLTHSSGQVDFFAALIAERTFGRVGLTAFYQLGILSGDSGVDGSGNTVSERNDTDPQHTIALVLDWAIDDHWAIGTEFAGILEPELDDEPVYATVFGQNRLNDNLAFDLGVRIGLSQEDSDDVIFVAGFTANLGRFF
jgi:hypothetical protein